MREIQSSASFPAVAPSQKRKEQRASRKARREAGLISYSCLMAVACCRPSLDHLILSLEHADRNCQTNLFCRPKVDDEFNLRGLLHGQISRFGTLQNLVHVNRRAPILVNVVRPIGHETALID